MYQESPRSGRRNYGGSSPGVGGQSPTKSSGMAVRSNVSGASLLSPSKGRYRTNSGNQGSRSGSPLTLSIENAQNLNPGAGYSMGQSYLSEGITGSVPSPSQRSPYQSPGHSRSSSMTSVKSLLKERTGDRSDREHMGTRDREHMGTRDREHMGTHTAPNRRGALVRDRSLDRQLDKQNRHDRDRYHTYGGHRDRSLDREYPHMGARSLERERERDHHTNLVRSQSIDHEYITSQAEFYPRNHDVEHSTLILDLQAHIANLNKECAILEDELDLTKEKLSSSMNSIKTFWSPELKKERVLRKEECGKLYTLNEQFRICYEKNQQQEDELRIYRESTTSQEGGTLRRDRHAKELLLLRKTVEEMELRIETQKQTLAARDESIKKLLEMLQSKGLAVKHIEEDRLEVEALRAKAIEADRRVKQLENRLDQKDLEITHLRQDSRVEFLERELKDKDEQLERMRSLGGGKGDGSNVQQLKSELDQSKSDVSHKDSELCAVRTKMETLEKQGADHLQHITVLREQISAKEQQTAMLKADVEMLQSRLKEKEGVLGMKSKLALAAQLDKKQRETQLAELKDHNDIKDRKISVLQKKMQNLEEVMQEKAADLERTQSQLSSLHADKNVSTSALTDLEETISEKNTQIERLKEQREKDKADHQAESESLETRMQELSKKLEDQALHLEKKQKVLPELETELSELKSKVVQKESQFRQAQNMLSEKTAAITKHQLQIKKLEEQIDVGTKQSTQESARWKQDATDRDEAIKRSREEARKSQKQVDQLEEVVKQSKENTDRWKKKAADLEETVKKLRDESDRWKKDADEKADRVKRTQEEGERRTKKASELEDTVKRAQVEIERWRTRATELEESTKRGQSESDRLRKKSTDLEETVKRSQSENERWRKKAGEFEDNILRSQAENERWRKKAADLEENIKRGQVENDRLKKKAAEFEESVRRSQVDIERCRKKTGEFEENVKRSQGESDLWRKKAAEYEENVRRSQSESERWRKKAAELEDSVRRSQDEIEKWRKDVAEKAVVAEKDRAEVERSQTEVDRLLDILKEMENEKYEKDKQIKDLQGQMKDNRQAMRRNQETDRKKNAQLTEDGRRRDDHVGEETSQLKTIISENQERIEELEEALRESVKITAHMEVSVAQHKIHQDEAQKQLKVKAEKLNKVDKQKLDSDNKVEGLTKMLEEKDALLRSLRTDRNLQMAEVCEMKQEALLAAISEKDAHIALLEMQPNKIAGNVEQVEKLTKEKLKLQQELKDLTETRMQLLQRGPSDDCSDSDLIKRLEKSLKEQELGHDGVWT